MIDLDTMTVLIVDDMKSMRRTIRNMFKQLNLGSLIRHAENGREGWKVLKSIPVDLAVIDWNMPVMNGIELLGKIRENRDLRDMPVIMITAESERDIVVEVAESEIDAYLLKPLTMKALDSKVRAIVHSANNPDAVAISLKKARDLEEQGNIPGSIEQIREALRERPNASRILRKMAELHIKINKDIIAEKCFKKAVAINKNDAVTRCMLSEFYRSRGDLENAGSYLLDSLSISSRAVSQAMELGDELLKKGRPLQAYQILEKAIEKSPDTAASKEKTLSIYLENTNYMNAKTLLEGMLVSQPKRYDLIFKLGMVYEKIGMVEKALAMFKKTDAKTEDNIEAKLYIARIYFNLKKTYAADDVIRDILEIDPTHEEALELRRKNT
ncbi:MAG: response regulator [Thermodesulfobacteriota bacterium]|nr:response regulator [Thermodesulfobacteriota bacterium]